jgi:tetratricopeptide (TPR) repeat protein
MRTAAAHDCNTHEAVSYEAEAAQWASAGRPDHAAHFYAATLDHRPRDTRVRMMLADCLVRCNQPAAAAGEYLCVALDYASQRRDAEAMALAYRVLHLDASQFVYVAVADVLRRMGRQARSLCARAAEAHLQVGRLADALHMLRLGAEIDAHNPDVRRRLAQIYLAQHMYGEAVANLAEAGRLLLAAGNNAEYVEVAELILRYDPRHLETLRELPRVYLRVGEPQRAVVKLADLMRVNPGDTVGYETLAHAFAVIGRVPTALSVLERLTGELVSTGRVPQAMAILERARSWRLDDPDFARAVLALREPAPKPAPASKPAQPRVARSTAEGTVVLDITDLMEPVRAGAKPPSAPEAVLDLSDDVIEIGEIEGTLVLRVQDLSHVGRAPRRLPPPPVAHRAVPPHRATPPHRAAPPHRAMPPHRAAPPRRAMPPRHPAPPCRTAALEGTQVIDLADIELEDVTLVRRRDIGDVTALVLDEDSAELHADLRATAGRVAVA